MQWVAYNTLFVLLVMNFYRKLKNQNLIKLN